MTTVAVAIATLDEAPSLAACLDAVRWADEIVVVDDGSTDGTVDIARRYTDRVVVRPSHGGFHANKNLAIEMCRSDWVLSLDADELVPGTLADEIRRTVPRTSHAAFRVGRRNHFLGRWIRHGGWYPDRVVRLFRAGVTSWPLEIHRTPEVSPPATVGDLGAELVHLSYRSLEHHLEKFNRYTTRLAREARARGDRPTLGSALANVLLRPPAWFLYRYVARGGYRDGVPGLYIAMSSALVILVTYFKLWELCAGREDRR